MRVAYPDRLTVCATPRGEALDERVFPELEAAADADVELIDMNNWVCPDPHSCAVVIGNVFVWRDSHHLTATYAETLAEPLEAKLRGTEAGAEILFDGRREISRGRACR
ncbi:SGNH hydrolase domain-containing protein [Leucobacter soli]|uniref:SGNH hydrolase domain-containing protein n=1 Tax=Leucobacter soli TaxID=2812850 RepID=UPI0036066C52